jgi:RimJ/RimL family protein N-acetyltransferase
MRSTTDGRVALRAVVPDDYERLYQWASTPGTGDRWRFPNVVPSYDDFVAQLWAGVLEQAMACSATTGEPMGLLTAYNADLRSGSCYVALVQDPQFRHSGALLVGAGLFLNELFGDWGTLRFVRVEYFSYNESVFGRLLTTVAELDGVLRDDLLWDGVLYDRILGSISREAWRQGLGGRVRDRVARYGHAGSPPPADDRTPQERTGSHGDRTEPSGARVDGAVR